MAPSARCLLAIQRTNANKDSNFSAKDKLIQPRAWLLNGCSEFSSASPGNVPRNAKFNPCSTLEDSMKKFGYIIAALGAIAIAAPSIASAETVVIKRGDHHRFGARAEFREHRDRGWHEGWRHRHGDRVVIIKHRRHDRY
jgi:hypothetical protein